MKNQIYAYIYICVYDLIGGKKQRESIADAAILLYMVSI
jgi:hypothetical protein